MYDSPRPVLTGCTTVCLTLAAAPLIALPFLPDTLAGPVVDNAPYAVLALLGLAGFFHWINHRPRREAAPVRAGITRELIEFAYDPAENADLRREAMKAVEVMQYLDGADGDRRDLRARLAAVYQSRQPVRTPINERPSRVALGGDRRPAPRGNVPRQLAAPAEVVR